ncbi:unnamed protein product, partial [Ilex paraguariensis]
DSDAKSISCQKPRPATNYHKTAFGAMTTVNPIQEQQQLEQNKCEVTACSGFSHGMGGVEKAHIEDRPRLSYYL